MGKGCLCGPVIAVPQFSSTTAGKKASIRQIPIHSGVHSDFWDEALGTTLQLLSMCDRHDSHAKGPRVSWT